MQKSLFKKMPKEGTDLLAETVKKTERDDAGVLNPERKKIITGSLADLLCYIGTISKRLGFTLEDVANTNLDKLFSRKERGMLGGDGDKR